MISVRRESKMGASRLALLACCGMLALAACSKKEPPPKTPTGLSVTVAPLAMQTLDQGLSASGPLVSREEAVVAPQVSGYAVSKVLVDQDASVKAGQPLAQLDDTLLQGQIAQQTAAVQSAQVAVDQAQQEADRVAGLDNSGVLSTEQIQQRRLALRTAQAQLANAQAALKDSQTRDGLMTVRAPVSGLVLTKTVRAGDVSSPGTAMFTIARDGVIELNAQVDEANLHNLRPGDHAQVTLASGAALPGTVRIVSPQVDAATHLGSVLVTLGASGEARPGGFAKAQFNSAGPPVMVAPEKAVTFAAEGASVYVVDDQNKVSKVGITTGRHAGGFVEILKGPPVGTKVVLGGAAFLLPGDVVRPTTISDEAAATAPAAPAAPAKAQ